MDARRAAELSHKLEELARELGQTELMFSNVRWSHQTKNYSNEKSDGQCYPRGSSKTGCRVQTTFYQRCVSYLSYLQDKLAENV